MEDLFLTGQESGIGNTHQPKVKGKLLNLYGNNGSSNDMGLPIDNANSEFF
jgi:hypothetical protein